jgi:hypothetical protein
MDIALRQTPPTPLLYYFFSYINCSKATICSLFNVPYFHLLLQYMKILPAFLSNVVGLKGSSSASMYFLEINFYN